MSELIGEVVLPGLVLNLEAKLESGSEDIVIGPGIHRHMNEVIVSKPGILCFKAPNMYWIKSKEKHYVPVKDDQVIAIVSAKMGDAYRVDIGAGSPATVHYLSFEGATKRYRPDIVVGDLLYGKVLRASKDFETELTCVNQYGKSMGMGVLSPSDSSFLLRCSVNLCRKILSKESNVMSCIGRQVPFESAVGMNGRIWLDSKSSSHTITIYNLIKASDKLTNTQISDMCNKSQFFTVVQ